MYKRLVTANIAARAVQLSRGLALATADLHNFAQETRSYFKKGGRFSTDSVPPYGVSDTGLLRSMDAAFKAKGMRTTAATFCQASNAAQEPRNRFFHANNTADLRAMAERAVQGFAPYVRPGSSDAALFEVAKEFEEVARLVGMPL